MPNKTRFVIYPDRIYTVTLDDGEEIEVTGLDIIQMGYHVRKTEKLLRALQELDQEGEGLSWLDKD
jgi:hypothetical protein